MVKPVVHMNRAAYDSLIIKVHGYLNETAGYVQGSHEGNSYEIKNIQDIPKNVMQVEKHASKLRHKFVPTAGELASGKVDEYMKERDALGLFHTHPQGGSFLTKADKKELEACHHYKNLKEPSRLHLIVSNFLGYRKVSAYVEENGKYQRAKVLVERKKMKTTPAVMLALEFIVCMLLVD